MAITTANNVFTWKWWYLKVSLLLLVSRCAHNLTEAKECALRFKLQISLIAFIFVVLEIEIELRAQSSLFMFKDRGWWSEGMNEKKAHIYKPTKCFSTLFIRLISAPFSIGLFFSLLRLLFCSAIRFAVCFVFISEIFVFHSLFLLLHLRRPSIARCHRILPLLWD